ncbi:hypothetical protein VE04_06712 [Pseudogymnoascus sp. 24MN13]|nr:hypothetical protein VE04_06712 [Pseudogymnoascus sp. 24MN13]
MPARKELHQAGVAGRKAERLGTKRVTAFQKAGQLIPPEDQEPVPDLEAQAQTVEVAGNGRGSGSEESDESSVEFHF